ncbi:hypothetical protein ABID59_001426 [Bradyrhizobium sp. S3.3.6]|uniref:hypothetical protein n=1 Tax=Bradyrhizobium sp. S3.3.6 TaxID=3156429 RepID=UPI003398ADFC
MPEANTRDRPITVSALAVLGAWLFVVLPSIYLPEGAFLSWLQRWQTLVGATVAMIAAALAYYNTTRSIKHARQIDSEKRARKHAALRAVLPLALSDITRYAAATVNELKEMIERCDREALPKNSATSALSDEAVPSKSLDVLAEFIEYSEAMDARLVETTLARIQIHQARLQSLLVSDRSAHGVVTRHQLESLVVDAAIIYAGASSFFAYARRAAEHPPIELVWDSVGAALHNMNVWADAYPRVHEDLSRREKASPSATEMSTYSPKAGAR